MKIPAFIISRDRVSNLALLVRWLEKSGEVDIIIVDNYSRYPPMTEYLDKSPHKVIRFQENYGPYVVWEKQLANEYPSDYFLVSDCDILPKEECPLNAVSHLIEILEMTQFYGKHCIGLGLEIKDLPAHFKTKQTVIDWEQRYWQTELIPGVYDARIDTTFSVYRKGEKVDNHKNALRTGYPYVARHLTWYENTDNPTLEYKFYRENADKKFANWVHLEEDINVL